MLPEGNWVKDLNQFRSSDANLRVANVAKAMKMAKTNVFLARRSSSQVADESVPPNLLIWNPPREFGLVLHL